MSKSIPSLHQRCPPLLLWHGVNGSGTDTGNRRALGKKLVSPSTVKCYEKRCIEFLSAPLPKATITYYPYVAQELGEEIAKFLQSGGHRHIPPLTRYTFHVNFLADLYTALLSPQVHFYATFTSNIGCYINEYVAGRSRVAQVSAIGHGGVALDGAWQSLH